MCAFPPGSITTSGGVGFARRDDDEETEFYLEPLKMSEVRVPTDMTETVECFNCQQTVYGPERKGCLCKDVRFQRAMLIAESRGYDRGHHDGSSGLKKRFESSQFEDS